MMSKNNNEDPACGSGGMFVSSADFTEQYGANANMAMTVNGKLYLSHLGKKGNEYLSHPTKPL